jgi:hypothetical protein
MGATPRGLGIAARTANAHGKLAGSFASILYKPLAWPYRPDWLVFAGRDFNDLPLHVV